MNNFLFKFINTSTSLSLLSLMLLSCVILSGCDQTIEWLESEQKRGEKKFKEAERKLQAFEQEERSSQSARSKQIRQRSSSLEAMLKSVEQFDAKRAKYRKKKLFENVAFSVPKSRTEISVRQPRAGSEGYIQCFINGGDIQAKGKIAAVALAAESFNVVFKVKIEQVAQADECLEMSDFKLIVP